MPYQSINPATAEVLQKFENHTDDQMMKALAFADSTYRESWSVASYKERAKYIGKAAAFMLEQKEALARIATLEMGKRISESRGEVELSAAIVKYYADNAEKFLADRALH